MSQKIVADITLSILRPDIWAKVAQSGPLWPETAHILQNRPR